MARPALHRRYDLTSLQLFIAVAEEQSLTAAARRENMVLSAASRRIAELEATSGASLLERHARGVTLTAAGKTLVHHARQMMLALHRMDGELSDHESGVRGRVRLYAIASALSQFLPEELNAFLAANPGVKIDLEEGTGLQVVEAVAEGVADAGIIAEQTPATGLQILPYHTDRLVLLVPPGHALERRRALRLAQALDLDFIGPRADSSLNALLVRAAAQAGRALKLRVQVQSFDVMCRMIEAGLGVAVLPAGAVRANLKARTLRAVRLAEPWAERRLFVCTRDADRLAGAVQRLVEHLSR